MGGGGFDDKSRHTARQNTLTRTHTRDSSTPPDGGSRPNGVRGREGGTELTDGRIPVGVRVRRGVGRAAREEESKRQSSSANIWLK